MRRAVALALGLWALCAGAAAADPHACARAAPEGWQPIERAIWDAISNNEPFDAVAFSARPEDRFVEPAFLRTLLTCERMHAELPAQGVALHGIVVPATLDLRFAEVPVRFVCPGCIFRGLDASDSRWRRSAVLTAAAVQERARFDGAVFDDELSLARARLPAGLNLNGIEVRRTLDLRFLADAGAVTARDARIGGKLRLDGAAVASLDLSSARIEGQVILSGVAVERTTVLDKLDAGSDVLLRTWPGGPRPRLGGGAASDERETAATTILRANNAEIGGRLEIAHATIDGAVSLDAVRIGEDIWLRDCSVVRGPLRLPFARIGQNLDLGTALLHDIDATGVTIGGELRLGTPGSARFTVPIWAPDARFLLRNARAASWVDRHDAAARNPDCPPAAGRGPWPDRIDVIGFAYDGLGGLGGGALDRREEAWFVAWIARQQPFSLEPYQRLAGKLRQAGREATGRAVLYAGKERERAEAGWGRWLLLTAQKLFVGYGIDKQIVLVWVALFTVTGWLVARRTPQARSVEPPLDLVWSFDQLVQIVQLRPEAKDIRFDGFARWYFYLHKLMGWVLGGFLLAAFAGLFGT